MNFTDFGLHPSLLKAIQDLGFTHPTPIQEKSIPPLMEGRDVIGIAQTGTGKTAAFLLPLLHRHLTKTLAPQPHPAQHWSMGKPHVSDKTPSAGMQVLVLAPTRELALQTVEHMKLLGKYAHVRGAVIIGGVGFEPQRMALRHGYEVIVATPGRLLDHAGRGDARFGTIKALVLDEADRMLDMGFMPDIRRILGMLPKERQNLMFSATMPPEIMRLSSQMMRNPFTVQIGQMQKPAAGITHAIYSVSHHLKTKLLLAVMRETQMSSALVFTRTKRRAEKLTKFLRDQGINADEIHGDRSQSQRTAALDRFRSGKTQVLVATDIASRGLDIEDISHVINFDVPPTPDDYIHRVGRTARMDAKGSAFTLVSLEEEGSISDIEKALGHRLPRVVLPDFEYGMLRPRESFVRPASPKTQTPGPSVLYPHRVRFTRRRR